MRTKLFFVVVVSLFSLVAQAVVQANPTDFTVTSPDGATFKLAEAKGKYVALHFLLKTECPFCLKHTQSYSAHSPEVAGVVQVFLKPDSADEIKKWAAKIDSGDAEMPVIYRDADAKLAKEYGIRDGFKFHGQTVHYPALVLLDPAGKEVFRYVGKDNTDRYSFEKFTAKMRELWAGELKEQNLGEGQLAIKGYDAVSFVRDQKSAAGDDKIQSLYRGAMYRFASAENRKLFAADPEKFVPAYGGWCATGFSMGDGKKLDIDPSSFKVTDGRLFLFYKVADVDARSMWLKDEAGMKQHADENWKKVESGK